MNDSLEKLIGKKITKVRMNEEYLVFETDSGVVAYGVDADCCSESYFHDFVGIRNLSGNGPVINVEALPTVDFKEEKEEYSDNSVEHYGFRITTVNETYGEQSSVFSFRNKSNGYYGGSITDADGEDYEKIPEITTDSIAL